MTASETPEAVSEKMNECLKSGSGKVRPNGRLWVLAAAMATADGDQTRRSSYGNL